MNRITEGFHTAFRFLSFDRRIRVTITEEDRIFTRKLIKMYFVGLATAELATFSQDPAFNGLLGQYRLQAQKDYHIALEEGLAAGFTQDRLDHAYRYGIQIHERKKQSQRRLRNS